MGRDKAQFGDVIIYIYIYIALVLAIRLQSAEQKLWSRHHGHGLRLDEQRHRYKQTFNFRSTRRRGARRDCTRRSMTWYHIFYCTQHMKESMLWLNPAADQTCWERNAEECTAHFCSILSHLKRKIRGSPSISTTSSGPRVNITRPSSSENSLNLS